MKSKKINLKGFMGAMLLFAMMVMMAYIPARAVTPIANFRQVDCSTDSIMVSWDAILEKNIKYHVYISQDNTNWTEWEDTSITETWLNKLTEGTSYYIKVVAVSNGTNVAESDVIMATTRPAAIKSVSWTGATADSVTITWEAVKGAEYYNIYADRDTKQLITTSATNTATIGGLGAGSEQTYYVTAARKAGGYEAVSYTGWLSSDCDVRTKTCPAQMAAGTYSVYHIWSETRFDCTTPNNADGTEIEAKYVKSKKNALATTDSKSISDSAGANKFIKYRVRAYVKSGDQRFYGAWSSWKYVAYQTVQAKATGKKSLKASWKKVAGASRYTVYVSTSDKSGWKKVKTVGSKANTLKITKIGKKKLKKNTQYYVKVVPSIKVGKKYVNSSIANTASATTLR